jgi:hypothetical protein
MLNTLMEQAMPILALAVSALLIFGALGAAGDWTRIGMLILAAFVAAIAFPLTQQAVTSAGNASMTTISSVAPSLSDMPSVPTQFTQPTPTPTNTLLSRGINPMESLF